jgi:metal-responsive CopG/Arc/MetJ family transcriptional regulator
MDRNFEIVVSVNQAFLSRLDSWCRLQPENPHRSEAIRRLAADALLLSETVMRQQSRS